MNELERLTDAARALAEVSTASEAWTLARTAEAARRYAQMRGLGHEAINYATGIKAKAMIMLADFVDAGQADGTVATAGRPKNVSDDHVFTLTDLLGTSDSQQARDVVRQARQLRDSLGGADIDQLINEANKEGDDLGIRGLRRAAAAKWDPAPVAKPVPPLSGKYSCIVIDPPWPVEKIERESRPDQGVKLDYPVMSLEQIADEALVPVRSVADDQCHMYLWVTHKYLPYGLELLQQWGFTYQCVMTWNKRTGVMPFSWRYDTEHVLYAHRGGLKLQRLGLALSFEAVQAKGAHSAKPEVFYDRVREASPGPRLDMFPGVEHDGFQPWGLEASHRA